jgi:formylmethanofuran dehydrogenase subunit E
MSEKGNVGQYTFDEYLDLIGRFHSYPAPGLIVGGYMVEMAKRHMPEGVLYDAISEAASCLPDAIQLLTPCTAGNGWLKIVNLDRYALSLFNKYTGEGVRVFLDVGKLDAYDEIRSWYLKLKTKKEQDSDKLRRQMREAGESVLTLQAVKAAPQFIGKTSKGAIAVCPLCGEAFPKAHGAICKGCQGEAPYVETGGSEFLVQPRLASVSVEQAVGKTALHDMTRIVPGQSKGAEFKAGQQLSVGDVCRLQQMGRMHVYVQEDAQPGPEWVHEDEAAEAFAEALCREGSLEKKGPPREGKITLLAAQDGLLVVDENLLEAFNLVPDVMCSTRHCYSVVRRGDAVAGTRAIPLYLSRPNLHKALSVLNKGPVLRVAPLRRARAGLLVTGTEVFQGIIQDKFAPTLTPKIEALGGTVVKTLIRPDDRQAIRDGVKELLGAGADLIVTTAGLSVDPDDVTRQGLQDAGATDMLYGMPVLPGAMTLLARIGNVQVLGVPACALFFTTTSFDLLLPRLLADLPVTRRDLARLGHGAMCKECVECKYPHCPMGK